MTPATGSGEPTAFQVAEFTSLRDEINKILRRGYDVHYGAMVIALGMLTYGISVSGLTSVCVIVSPVLVLSAAFRIILEQVKTLRRNAAYIRVFYEGWPNRIFWETDLNRLREDRIKDPRPRVRDDITVSDILKAFPNEYDWFVVVCLIAAFVRTYGISQTDPAQASWAACAVVAASGFWLVYVFSRRKKACLALVGGGDVDREYFEEWQRIQQIRASEPGSDRMVGAAAVEEAAPSRRPGRKRRPDGVAAASGSDLV